MFLNNGGRVNTTMHTKLISKYSFVPNCLIVWGKWSNCKFWEKKPQVHFNYYKRMTKKYTPHFKKS